MSVESESRRASQLQLALGLTAVDIFLAYPEVVSGLLIRGSTGSARECLRHHIEERFTLHRLSTHTTQEQLYGCIDTQQTLATGKIAHQEGLLSRFSKDVLQIDVTRAMPVSLSRHLADAVDKLAPIDRPGLVVFDENAEDVSGVADSSLAERLPIHIFVPGVTLAELAHAESIRDKGGRQQRASALSLDSMRLVKLDDALLSEVVKLCVQLGIVSCRAATHCASIARAHAALRGRSEVSEQDVAIAVQLTLAPRASLLPDTNQTEPAEPIVRENPPDDNTSAQSEHQIKEPQDTQPQDNMPAPSCPDNATDDASPPVNPDQAIDERLIAAAKAVLPSQVLNGLTQRTTQFRRMTNPSSAGRSETFFMGGNRGRATGVRRSRTRGRGEKLDVLETIKCSIPHQRIRRLDKSTQPDAGSSDSGKLQIRSSDIRVTNYRQTARTTTVFVVDASGSTALQRLSEAKGAVELLLGECYVRRDRVALITFRATIATLELPPTRSLTRAKRALNGLPGGGGTPLASGIQMATDMVRQLRQAGEIPVVVFMTDASANIALDGCASRMEAALDAEQQARQLALLGVQTLFIDTSTRPRPQAQKLASAMRANYLPLPRADARLLPSILRASA